jgi:hypothetical protein
MALQQRDPSGVAFNPARDMVWALPRLLHRAFRVICGGKKPNDGVVMEALERNGISCDDPTGLLDKVGLYERGLLQALKVIRDKPDDIDAISGALALVYVDELRDIHLLVSAELAKVMYANLIQLIGLVIDQADPLSQPTIEEVEKEVDEIFGRLPS